MSRESLEEKCLREKHKITRFDVLAAIRSIKIRKVCHAAIIQRYARVSLPHAGRIIDYLHESGIVGGEDKASSIWGREVLVDIAGLQDE